MVIPFLLNVVHQISSIISISVTIAMYCLLQLYLCVATELAPHRPVLKLVSIKAVGRFGLPTLHGLGLMEY